MLRTLLLFLALGVATSRPLAAQPVCRVLATSPPRETAAGQLYARAIVPPAASRNTDAATKAWLYWGEEATWDASIFLQADTAFTVQPNGDTRRRLDLVQGELLVQYQSQDGQPLLLSAGNTWVALQRGTLRGRHAGGNVAWDLLKGDARQFEGEPSPDADGKVMSVTPDPADPAEQAQRELFGAFTADACGGFLSRAEAGDLVPMRGFSGQGAGSQFAVSPQAVVPQVAVVSTPAVGSSAAPVTPVTQAQALLASGSPASVIVGARLERTRIIGNPGTTGAGTLRFNTQARPPFRLGG